MTVVAWSLDKVGNLFDGTSNYKIGVIISKLGHVDATKRCIHFSKRNLRFIFAFEQCTNLNKEMQDSTNKTYFFPTRMIECISVYGLWRIIYLVNIS